MQDPKKVGPAATKESDSDSDNEFNRMLSEMLGNYMQEFKKHQNTKKTQQQVNKENNSICAATGDFLARDLVELWSVIQQRKTSGLLSEFERLKSQMNSSNYPSDEVNTIIEFCKSGIYSEELRPIVDAILATKGQGNIPVPVRNKASEIRFAELCPIKGQSLNGVAQGIKEEDYKCFTNPSRSIREAWNNDIKWYQYCYAAIELSKNENHKNAMDFYRWFGFLRYQISALLKHQRENIVFGRLRFDTYFGLGSAAFTQVTKQPSSTYGDQYSFCNSALTSIENIKNNDCIENSSISIDLGNVKKTFNLTVIHDPVTKVPLSKIYRTKCKDFPCIIICHPAAIHIDTVFKKAIQPIYEKLIAAQDTELIYYYLGKMVWYFSQLMPAEGGSAAITLMSLYDILKRKNLPLVPLQGEISLDFRAIFEPDVEKFARNFSSLVTSKPSLQSAPL